MTTHDDQRRGPAPWQIGRPQPAVRALAAAGVLTGRMLEVGCGTGEHTLLAAEWGAEVTAVDLDKTALTVAQEQARARGLHAAFLHGDVLDLPTLGIGVFDTILDSLVLHAIPADRQPAYGRALARLAAPNARLHVLGYAAAQPDVPHHLEPDDIRSALAPHWRFDSGTRVAIETQRHPAGAQGWLFSLTVQGGK